MINFLKSNYENKVQFPIYHYSKQLGVNQDQIDDKVSVKTSREL